MPGPGPRGRGGPRGMKPTVDNPLQIMKRLLGYVAKFYKWHLIAVVLLIITSVLCSVRGTMFIQSLIDDYITPMLQQDSPDFGPLLHAILKMACIYAVGVAASYIYNLLMLYVTQGTLRKMRNEIFEHMEKLPVKYFDTHKNGDIMSVYTNDIDTLRQMISQSIPQLINSSMTIISVTISMLILNIPLTIISFAMVGVVLFTTGKVGGRSGKYFMKQQKDLGTVNGYIEEMISGQKVVKVFCHEEAAKKEFKELNDQLYDSAYNANFYANVLGPINAQLGNTSYVICAISGGLRPSQALAV